MRKMLIPWACAVMLGIGALGHAQPPGSPSAGPDRNGNPEARPGRPGRESRPPQERARRGGRMLEQVMLARLSEELELSDEQTVLMVRKFTDFRARRAELRKEREHLMKGLREAIDRNAPDTEIEGQLARLREQNEALMALTRALYEELSKDLSPRQRAKLFLFLERFDAEVQQMMRRVEERRVPPPPPPEEPSPPEAPERPLPPFFPPKPWPPEFTQEGPERPRPLPPPRDELPPGPRVLYPGGPPVPPDSPSPTTTPGVPPAPVDSPDGTPKTGDPNGPGNAPS